jgi:pimeloyl-ACP methyl ester carboxylesterase
LAENLPALAAERQIIAVDLQGHGRTADIDRPINVRSMADDIAALVNHLGHEQVDAVGYSLGGGVALQLAIRRPELVRKLVIASTPIRRDAFFTDILAQQAYVTGAMAEMMKDTPMYQLYKSIAPRVEDFPKLLDKMGQSMKEDFDFSKEVAALPMPTLVAAGDSDIFPVRHAVETFELLGGGQRDGGWDGSGRPKSSLAVLPGLTHYTIFSAPALSAAGSRFSTSRLEGEPV